MPDTTRVAPPDPLAIEQLGRVAQIVSVTLLSVKAEQLDATASQPGARFDRPVVRFRTTNKEAGTTLFVRARFEGKGIAAKVQDGLAGFDIGAEFEIAYLLGKSEWSTPENLAAFAAMNGTFNAWPFWRELVLSTLARMGMPNVVVPLFLVRGKP